jgi:hypothetical protein
MIGIRASLVRTIGTRAAGTEELPMTRSRRIRVLLLMALACLVVGGNEGCAHRRQSYYGSDVPPTEGVHVRAPFVDVQVNRKPKSHGDPRLSHHDDDDDDDDDD